jgi:hypothetical protein
MLPSMINTKGLMRLDNKMPRNGSKWSLKKKQKLPQGIVKIPYFKKI